MEPTISTTQTEIEAVFALWNEKAAAENWNGPRDAAVSAQTFVELLDEVRAAKAAG